MGELPRHVGRRTDPETDGALVCTVATDGNVWGRVLCGQRATHHIRWEEATTENGLACAEHLHVALAFRPFDVHSVEGSACCMPGSAWVLGEPSRCDLDVLDGDPDRSGHTAAALTGS